MSSKEFTSAIIQAGDNMPLATESNGHLLIPELHPDESIADILQKQGITRIDEQPDFGRDKVLKVTWGVSDKE